MAHHSNMFLSLPYLAASQLMGLSDDERFSALDLAEKMRGAFTSANPRAYLMEVATANSHRGRGWSFKRLEAHYYALRRGANPGEVLVNKSKERGNKSDFLTPAVLEHWRTLCDRHFRSHKSAYLELIADYRIGKKIGDVDWRTVWGRHDELSMDPIPTACPRDMPLPCGWSYHNFMRHKPRKVEELGAHIGRMAAHALARPVRTTRDGMEPGQQYTFDDLEHDNEVIFPGERKAVRALELACLDWASAYKVAKGTKPATLDALGKRRQKIKERDMRFLVAHVLINIGFHREGVLLLVENGTAAICEEMELALQAKEWCRPDGTPLIRVSRSGVDRETAHPGQWGTKAKGNFRHKSALESWNNLSHNRLDDLPGQTGSNSRLNAPEEQTALQATCHKLLLAGMALTPDLAKRIRMPVLDWDLFNDILDERYAQIHATHDHQLEGWEHHMERQWRVSLTDHWHSEASWNHLTDEQQARLAPLIAQEGMVRVAKKSRWQVWQAGLANLIRLPDYAVTLICGRDLAEPRPCPAMAEVTFVDQEISATPMRYRLQSCVNKDGVAITLAEGHMYLWMINPFDPRAVFVMEENGTYVGRCDRVDVPCRTDTEAVGREIGLARKDFAEALAPLARRGMRMAQQQLKLLQHNTQVLREGAPVAPALPEATTKAPELTAEEEAEIEEALSAIEMSMGSETKE